MMLSSEKNITKVPIIETTYRWIDIYSFFNYPDEIRDNAYKIVTEKQNNLGYPHVAAATAIMIACGSSVPFDFTAIRNTTQIHRKSIEPGILMDSIYKRKKTWKL